MTDTTKFPFMIFGIDPSGLNVVVDVGRDKFNPITAKAETLMPGLALDITEATYEANKDVNGVCWLDFTDDEQLQHWGKVRFGRGPVSDAVKTSVDAERRAKLTEERDFLLSNNPHLAKRTASGLRLDELDRELAQ